jgi:molybdopterin synthase catalytic subunit
MNLRVRLFAALRERAGRGELDIDDLPDALDLATLKRAIAARHPELGDLAHVAAVVDEHYAPETTRLTQTSRVALLPPVSGGSPDPLELGRFELSATPLDVAGAQARVAHPSCGAVVVFTGTTRATNRERDVVRLDYEAFPEMAGAEMARIFADCRELFRSSAVPQIPGGSPLLRMLCVHRIGTVGVGEPSVVIAVASPHRDEAFRAARFLIDELKARLPVWKKEVYADGHHWIGDRS